MPGTDSRPLRERLMGSWRLLSYEVRDRVGARVGYPLGDDATGCLLYTADSFMSVQIMRPGRLRYRAGGLGDGTDAESSEAPVIRRATTCRRPDLGVGRAVGRHHMTVQRRLDRPSTLACPWAIRRW
jgi:hypothetical protein